jgi:hypothetical protein
MGTFQTWGRGRLVAESPYYLQLDGFNKPKFANCTGFPCVIASEVHPPPEIWTFRRKKCIERDVKKNQHSRLEKLALGNPINLKTIKPNPVVLALSKHLKVTEF